MPSLLDLLTPVLLRVDAAGGLEGADEPSRAWLAGREDRSLAKLCGVDEPAQLVEAQGPWRALALPEGAYLVSGSAWQSSEAIAGRLAKTSLQDKQVLLNVMPSATAEELAARTLQPKAYRESTILFIDAVQFSRLAARVDPVSCLKQLDFYFSLFDQVTAAFGVEKVKTIGDAYMGVAGVPHRRAAHAVDATLAALRVARAIAARPGPVVDDWEWSFRLGLHSGPCITGVLGARRQVFDLWGDTVSVAAQVQRVGRPDTVSVSGPTVELIGGFFDIGFDGTTVIHHSGEIAVHVVRGIRPELLADAEEGIVNAEFCKRYEALFGEACPEAAWRPQAASAALLGAL
ncbi:MAG TPA: adenylate/guanylate cyclase domain-containing protein [Nannocystis sp.]|jgi:class 3 adenylate cyclase